MRYKPRYFQILYPLVSLVAVTQRAPIACNATVRMFCHISLKRQEKRNYFPLWEMCFILFIESVLIMRGTLGWCGSSSVENIDEFFFPRLQT